MSFESNVNVSDSESDFMSEISKYSLIDDGIAGNSRALPFSSAARPAFPNEVKPVTFDFVAWAKYSAEGSSRLTIPREGIVSFVPAIVFTWLFLSRARKNPGTSQRDQW